MAAAIYYYPIKSNACFLRWRDIDGFGCSMLEHSSQAGQRG